MFQDENFSCSFLEFIPNSTTIFQKWNTKETIIDKQGSYYCENLIDFPWAILSNSNFLKMNNHLAQKVMEKKSTVFLGFSRTAFLVRVFLLKAFDWFNCREKVAMSVNDVGKL